MADLFPCPSCGRDVSRAAAACPGCGHQFRDPGGINPKDPVHALGLIVVAVIIIGVIWYIVQVTG